MRLGDISAGVAGRGVVIVTALVSVVVSLLCRNWNAAIWSGIAAYWAYDSLRTLCAAKDFEEYVEELLLHPDEGRKHGLG